MVVTARVAIGLTIAALGIGVAGPARAEEVKQQLNAPLILNLLARPLESPEVAFNKELGKAVGPQAGTRNDEPEVLPDGSVRYGRGPKSVTITVRNPCPPGDIEHEMAQLSPYRNLPGRGRK
jgi:hypothetical protein